MRPSYKTLSALADRMDILPEKLLEDIDLGLETNCRFKLAQAMVAAKEYEAAIPLLEDLVQERTVLSKIEMKLELATCYLHTNRFEDAEPLLKDLHHTATVRGDSRLLAVVNYHFGLQHYHRNKHQVAMYNGFRAIEQLDKHPLEEQDHFLRLNILTMLGHVYQQMGSLHDALRYYHESTALHTETSNLHELAGLYMKMGQDEYDRNSLNRSFEYSERACAIFRSVEEVVKQSQLGIRISLSSEDREWAISQVRSTIEKLHNLGQHQEVGTAFIDLADLHLQIGDVEEASCACDEASVWLPESHFSQASLHLVRGRIACKSGQWEDAVLCFQKAADLFWSRGEWRRWDDALHELANVYAGEQDHQRAYEVAVYAHDHRQTLLLEQGIVL